MGFADTPFVPALMGRSSSDPRRFPGHAEVRRQQLALCAAALSAAQALHTHTHMPECRRHALRVRAAHVLLRPPRAHACRCWLTWIALQSATSCTSTCASTPKCFASRRCMPAAAAAAAQTAAAASRASARAGGWRACRARRAARAQTRRRPCSATSLMRWSCAMGTTASPTCQMLLARMAGRACSCTATTTACQRRLLIRLSSSSAHQTQVGARSQRVISSRALPAHAHACARGGRRACWRALPCDCMLHVAPALHARPGEDVCREVSAVAREVVLAARSWKNPAWASDATPFGPRGNISRRGMVSALHPDGSVEFTEVGRHTGVRAQGMRLRTQSRAGTRACTRLPRPSTPLAAAGARHTHTLLPCPRALLAQGPPLPAADAIIYCTGYVYRFRMLEHVPALGGLSGQQYVPGLYRHLVAPRIGASLSFIGLPWRVVPFPQFELQAALVARLATHCAAAA